MPNLIDLRRRIRSVKNTQQITSAINLIVQAQRLSDGTGLGLVISKQLCEMLGGEGAGKVGKRVAVHCWPTLVVRAVSLSLGSPGTLMPERSPLMSAAKTGTPWALSCSASSWSVFVLPVPVAPATRPCRLTIVNGIRTAADGSAMPSTTSAPSSIAGPSNA